MKLETAGRFALNPISLLAIQPETRSAMVLLDSLDRGTYSTAIKGTHDAAPNTES